MKIAHRGRQKDESRKKPPPSALRSCACDHARFSRRERCARARASGWLVVGAFAAPAASSACSSGGASVRSSASPGPLRLRLKCRRIGAPGGPASGAGDPRTPAPCLRRGLRRQSHAGAASYGATVRGHAATLARVCRIGRCGVWRPAGGARFALRLALWASLLRSRRRRRAFFRAAARPFSPRRRARRSCPPFPRRALPRPLCGILSGGTRGSLCALRLRRSRCARCARLASPLARRRLRFAARPPALAAPCARPLRRAPPSAGGVAALLGLCRFAVGDEGARSLEDPRADPRQLPPRSCPPGYGGHRRPWRRSYTQVGASAYLRICPTILCFLQR